MSVPMLFLSIGDIMVCTVSSQMLRVNINHNGHNTKTNQKVHPQSTYICSLTSDFPNLAALRGVV